MSATDPSRFDLTGQPWFRLDGAQIVVSATDLGAPAGDKMLTTVNVNSSGSYVDTPAWTGSGVAPGVTTDTVNCADWSTQGAMGYSGATSILSRYMTQSQFWAAYQWPCTSAYPVYCFEK